MRVLAGLGVLSREFIALLPSNRSKGKDVVRLLGDLGVVDLLCHGADAEGHRKPHEIAFGIAPVMTE
jgi:hypothetical protein